MELFRLLGPLIIIVGCLFLIRQARRKGLYGFDGTRYRDRIQYGLYLMAIMVPGNFFVLFPSSRSLILGLILSVPLSIVAIACYRWFLDRRLDGNVLRYKPKQYQRNLLWCVPVMVGSFALGWYAGPSLFNERSYIFVACTVTPAVIFVYSLYDLNKREAALGQPILESSELPSEPEEVDDVTESV